MKMCQHNHIDINISNNNKNTKFSYSHSYKKYSSKIQSIITTFLIILVFMSSTQQSTSFATSSSSSSSNPSNENISQKQKEIKNNDVDNDTDKNDNPILQLPPSSSDSNSDIPVLKMGDVFKLDHLGPIIINTDGTTRRIDNWDTLTEKEKEVSWRRIKKRNEERRKMLMEKDIETNEL